MNKTKINSVLQKILIVFLIIQPIFDFKIFYNSVSTLIRVIVIFGLFIIYFFQDKSKKKYLLLIYPVILFAYFIFHHINATRNFSSLVPGDFNYSAIKEILYFVKMVTPFLLIYTIYKSKLNKEQIIKIIKSIVIIISLTIIITNIFGVSYGSYSDEPIKANFFSWFINGDEYVYQDLASKGLFEYANQISAILIIFLPLVLLELQKKDNKIINIAITIMNILALLLLGTKVAVLGIIIDIFFTACILIFNKLINKEKFEIKHLALYLIPIIFYIALLPFNPMLDRQEERKIITTSSEIIEEEIVEETEMPITIAEENKNIELNEQEIKQNEIDKIAQEKLFHTEFYKQYYPYDYDIDFWYDFIQQDRGSISDYRYVEEAIIKRVVELNNNKFDKWLGITNTRLQNIFNIEKDFVVQYYALGIIGIILVFIPYLFILVYFVINVLKNKLKNIKEHQYLCFGMTILSFCIAYYSGNLLNSLSFTIYLSVIVGLLAKKD